MKQKKRRRRRRRRRMWMNVNKIWINDNLIMMIIIMRMANVHTQRHLRRGATCGEFPT